MRPQKQTKWMLKQRAIPSSVFHTFELLNFKWCYQKHNSIMRLHKFLFLVFPLLIAGGCSQPPTSSSTLGPRIEGLEPEIRALGNRNWIVIGDQSFPTHSRRGVRTLLVDAEIPQVLSTVMQIIESQAHVYPKVYQGSELTHISNDVAPGIKEYRKQLDTALQGYERKSMQYKTLSLILEDTSKTFTVLVLKTRTALPYSAIFLELDSGYWDGAAEKELRSRIEPST